MKYLCGKCIHFDVCYVPRSIGCVEICGHFKEEPKEPMTEQEYLQTCDTEQLASAFFEYRYVNATPRQKLWMSASEECIKTDIVEWLKKTHKE